MTTPRPILHHYPSSPFSEKVRLLLGYKKLDWQSVIIPSVLPKPDVMALTGGYRKTPILQLGCDVYCDTRLIAQVLDQLAPEPVLYPQDDIATCNMLAQFADQALFYCAVPYSFQPEAVMRMASALPADEAVRLLDDRKAMSQDARVKPTPAKVAFTHFPVYLAQLEQQLSRRSFLLGATPCIADFSLYHSLWFIDRATPTVFEATPAVRAFMQRMAAIGHGESSELSSAQAIEVCRASAPRARKESWARDQNGVELGAQVMVRPGDMGRDPTLGTLVHLAEDEIAIERHDERAGRVIVHFPRIGYELFPQ